MNEWLAKLSERERRFVTIGAIAAGLLVLLAIVMPLTTNVSKASQRIDKKRADLAFMQSVAGEVAAAGPGAPGGSASGESLVVLIDRSARESGLGPALQASEPSGERSLRVRLERASFDLLVGWMGRLSQQHGVEVESAEIEGAGEAGLVNAGLVLRMR
jgi:type II secretory pathway component PulM